MAGRCGNTVGVNFEGITMGFAITSFFIFDKALSSRTQMPTLAPCN